MGSMPRTTSTAGARSANTAPSTFARPTMTGYAPSVPVMADFPGKRLLVSGTQVRARGGTYLQAVFRLFHVLRALGKKEDRTRKCKGPVLFLSSALTPRIRRLWAGTGLKILQIA